MGVQSILVYNSSECLIFRFSLVLVWAVRYRSSGLDYVRVVGCLGTQNNPDPVPTSVPFRCGRKNQPSRGPHRQSHSAPPRRRLPPARPASSRLRGPSRAAVSFHLARFPTAHWRPALPPPVRSPPRRRPPPPHGPVCQVPLSATFPSSTAVAVPAGTVGSSCRVRALPSM